MRNFKILSLLMLCLCSAWGAKAQSITIDSLSPASQCPGVSFKVYFHYTNLTPGSTVEVKVSSGGGPYTALPNAHSTTVASSNDSITTSFPAAASGNYLLIVKSDNGGPGGSSVLSGAWSTAVGQSVGTPVFANGPTSTRCQGSGTSVYKLSNAATLHATAISYAFVGAAGASTITTAGDSATVTWASGFAGPTATIRVTATGCGGPKTEDHVVTINPAPVATATAAATSICSGNSVTINLSATNGGNQFSWSPTTVTNVTGAGTQATFGSGGSITDVLANTTDNTDGTVIYAVNAKNSTTGCTSIAPATVTVTVKPKPTITVTGPSMPICSGSPATINLSASTPGTDSFTWVPTQTGVTGASSQSSAYAPVSSFTNTLTTTSHTTAGNVAYLITPKSAAGCVGASTTFTVNVNPDPVLTNTAPATPICSGTPFTMVLAASTGAGSKFTYASNSANGVTGGKQQATYQTPTTINDTLKTGDHTNSGSITYSISIQSAANCLSLTPATIAVNVNPDPVLNSTAPATPICSGSPATINLSASTPGTDSFTWVPTQTGVTGASSQSSAYAPVSSFTNTLTTTSHTTAGNVAYLITPKSAAGCVGASTTFTVNVNPDPRFNDSATKTICSGTTVNFNTTAMPGYSYKWNTNGATVGVSGNLSSNGIYQSSNRPFFENPSPSIQAIISDSIWTKSALGCESLSPTVVQVIINPRPRITSALSGASCAGVPITVNPSTSIGVDSITWVRLYNNGQLNFTGPGTGNSANVTNTASFNLPNYGAPDTVRYAFRLKSAAACIGSDTFVQRVNPIPVVTNNNPPAICSGTQLNIQLTSSILASGSVNYQWSSAATPKLSGNVVVNSPLNAISQTLIDSTNTAVTAKYTITASAFGCTSAPKDLYATVNPKPIITGLTNSYKQCNGLPLNIPISDTITGTQIYRQWTTVIPAGSTADVSPRSNAGVTNIISGTVSNSSSYVPANLQYTVVDSVLATGCKSDPVNFIVTVNPTPVLPPVIKTICSQDSIRIDLSGTTTGANSEWKYTYFKTSGISGADSSIGFSNIPAIHQRLVNSSDNLRGFVVYSITPRSQQGCVGAMVKDSVYVNPLPTLRSISDTSICSDSVLTYRLLASTGDNTQYSWTKVGSYGAPGNPSFQSVRSLLRDSLSTGGLLARDSVIYNFRLRSDANCYSDTSATARPSLTVKINPTPAPVAISIYPASICQGVEMLNFGAGRIPASGERFTWISTSGNVYQLANPTQNALISFPAPGNQQITVTSSATGFACKSKAVPLQVSVSANNGSSKPIVQLFNGAFVCLTGPSGAIQSYQWGYDLKSDLDSQIVENQTSQSYRPNNLADTTTKAFWVMATYTDGCTYKAYYNKITGLGVGHLVDFNGQSAIQVFPNPATSRLNVAFAEPPATGVLEVIDLAGRQLLTEKTTGPETQLDISRLPAGSYFLNAYTTGGRRIATARFIKN